MTETTKAGAEATSITVDVTVDVPQAEAFKVFTEEFDGIKPREHNLLAVDVAETVLEPHVGGSVYDRGVDGSTCRWGRVLAFEPTERLVFTWDIGVDWRLETDLARASEVEVRFVALDARSTRVELTHRHLDRHLDGWQSLRDGVASEGGWPVYLQRYAALTAA
ncbi:SRPBCC family protein [Nocardioides sp. CER19]|uniref:SRPBCC family protein n=1 Tax=Nocardioides sp. CER19 TaxID=3038538 RepID=UPI00244C9628|nr:SRPBCC family protein [Nocardioides sp. CER19]MDH2412652.1 SRPBCC family protein [Nocardioides sp. CER19]